MSDTCYSSLRCRQVDREKFEALGFRVIEDIQLFENEHWIDLEFEECNYGAYDDLHSMAAAGIPFHGRHGSGSDYPECVFAAADGMISWPAAINGRPAVSAPVGVVDDGDMAEVVRYVTLLRRAKELLGEADDDTHPGRGHIES